MGFEIILMPNPQQKLLRHQKEKLIWIFFTLFNWLFQLQPIHNVNIWLFVTLHLATVKKVTVLTFMF